MRFNVNYKLGGILPDMPQEDILACPEIFCLSLEDTLRHKACTQALRNVLLAFPWSGRPSVIQVRPQDFRAGRPHLLGDEWHVDTEVIRADAVERKPPSLDDYRLLSVSLGNVTETEFIATPMQFENEGLAYDLPRFLDEVKKRAFTTETAKPNQIVTYTSRDIHRMSPAYRVGRARLLIINFESETVPAGGHVRPSLSERG